MFQKFPINVVQSLSRVQQFATLWTIVCQAPLSVGFQGKNPGVGCRFLPPGVFPTLDRTPVFCFSCVAGGFFTAEPLGRPFEGLTCLSQHRLCPGRDAGCVELAPLGGSLGPAMWCAGLGLKPRGRRGVRGLPLPLLTLTLSPPNDCECPRCFLRCFSSSDPETARREMGFLGRSGWTERGCCFLHSFCDEAS